MLHVIGFRKLPLTLLLGSGYGVGTIAVAKLLHLASLTGASLTGAGWVMVFLGLCAGGWVVRFYLLLKLGHETELQGNGGLTLAGDAQAWYRDPIIVALLVLLAAHLSITLTNNLLRPIFAWDAFTTWMYRAKAWALQNSITPMANLEDWIAAGGQSGYALRANHYPTALSVYAAFMSSLTGDWQDAAASIPWSLCFLALCLATHGMLALTEINNRLSVIGAYLLGSMPLLNVHASLAGYADLWMTLLTGVGLAGLLVWRATNHRTALWMGLLLLILATQVKIEGWLWLGLGLIFLLIEHAAARIGYALLAAVLIISVGVAWASGVSLLSLGPLGQWGVSDSAIHAGDLGTHALKPLNPASKYWDALFEQANFLLLAGFYVLAMAALTMRWRKRAGPFWVMGLLVTVSQLIIFGLSSYSQYLETSTAGVRLLMHFTPVFLVTVIFGWRALPDANSSFHENPTQLPASAQDQRRGQRLIISTLFIMLALIMPALPFLKNQALPTLQNSGEEMLAVVGRVKSNNLGTRFIESPINVGVMKAPTQKLIAPAPYLLSDVTFSVSEDVSFYWINEGSTQVNRTPLLLSGRSFVDLRRYRAWRQGNKSEVGFLVNDNAFEDSYIRELSLVTELDQTAFSALFNHWTSTDPLTQKTINGVNGHIESPYSLAQWLNLGLLLAVLFSGSLWLLKKDSASGLILGTVTMSLWLLADTASMATAPTLDCLSARTKCLSTTANDPHARDADDLAALIVSKIPAADPILVFEARNALHAQKLPLLMLPRPSVRIRRLNQVPADWLGSVVVVGVDPEISNATAKRIAEKLDRPQVLAFETVRLILGDNQ